MNNNGANGATTRQLKGKPRLVRSGKVAVGRPFAKVLQLLMSNENTVELGILHVRGAVFQGDIVIASGQYILGASTSCGLTGWRAVRTLLQLNDAVYQFHDFGNTDIGSLDQGMSVRVQRILGLLPNLPETLEEFNASVSVNRIRAMNIDQIIEDKMAEKATTKYLAQEVQKFEEKTMQFRAIILWGFFALMSLAAVLIHQFMM